MMVNLPIDAETLDAIVCARLRVAVKDVQKMGDDPKEDKKLIAALRRVIRYYGGTVTGD